MNIKLFNELEKLISTKNGYEGFLNQLKHKPYMNQICLSKGICNIYFDDDLIPILIKYYEEKIKEIDEEISMFKLTKTIE